MNKVSIAWVACLAALVTGCPGMLPATDRAFDGAVALDVPVVPLDRGPAVDVPVMAVVDRPAPVDVPVTVVDDTGPDLDTGVVTSGTDSPGCGRNNAPCCEGGRCEGDRVCLASADGEAARCADCGGNHQPCCAFGACEGERHCVATPGRAPTCR